jgi:hypothetical protein
MTTLLPAAMLAEEVEQTLEPIPISAGRSRGPRHPRARLSG